MYELKKIKRRDGLNFNKKRASVNTGLIKTIVIYAVDVILAVALAYFCVIYFGTQVRCTNLSMEPTIASQSKVLVDKLIYQLKEPDVGDIVVFKPYTNVNADLSIKRIVALPGDEVLIKNGKLYVNGTEYVQPGITESIINAGVAGNTITLKDNEYFLLGDNRNSSEDSRFETIGNVNINNIVGKVWMIFERGN